MGALCCVAARPCEAKSSLGGRDSLNGHGELQWRTNSSFSPPPLWVWDSTLQSDGLSHEALGVHGSSRSSNSRRSRSGLGSEQFTNYQHSVSDGVLSYSDSPPVTVREPGWQSPRKKFSLDEHAASSVGGSRSQTSWFLHSTERRYALKANVASPVFGSPSSLSESSHGEPTSKLPFSSRRSHITKAVYPLVICNPVSECEIFADADVSSFGRLTPGEDQTSPFHWPSNNSSIDHKFHRTLTQIQKLQMSPDPSASSKKDDFRWSSASSYDLGLDAERFDVAEHTDVESAVSPVGPVADQKCGVCGKYLWLKSTWSPYRIMRGIDIPTAGVLHCSHVFHAECLEQMTPKTQIHDPPCPLCLKTSGDIKKSTPLSEPLQMVLTSLQRSRVVISEGQENCSGGGVSNHIKERQRGDLLGTMSRQDKNGSFKNRIKGHLAFKEKVRNDIIKSKIFQRIGSSIQ